MSDTHSKFWKLSAFIVAGLVVSVIIGNLGWRYFYVLPQVHKVIGETMRDPDSMQFRNEVVLSEPSGACGEVNAKNGMGGYTGFTRFVATTSGSLVTEGDPVTNWPAYSETDRIVGMMQAQIDHASKFNATFEALSRFPSQQNQYRLANNANLSSSEAYKVSDLAKFKEIWNSLCL